MLAQGLLIMLASEASFGLLYTKQKNGRYRLATNEEVFAEAARLRLELYPPRTRVQTPTEVHTLLRDTLAHLPYEVVCCLFLDTRHGLIRYEELFRGTIDGAVVHTREVVKRALHWNASTVILGHNHPSGVAEPSEADRNITLKLAKALALVEVRLLDHIVVGGESHVSLAERGWI